MVMVMVRERWFGLRKRDFRKWVGVVGRLRTTRNKAAIAIVSRASRVWDGKARVLWRRGGSHSQTKKSV